MRMQFPSISVFARIWQMLTWQGRRLQPEQHHFLQMLRQQELLVWKIWPGWEARMLIDPSGESS